MAHFLKKSTPWLDQQLGSLFLQLAPLDLCLKVEQDEKRNFEAAIFVRQKRERESDRIR